MSKKSPYSGALIIDKPSGMTSHDVVSQVRRRLSMRKVGHAGTLDPLATGVLLVLVGEGTKLVPFLTANDKRYRAEIQLGWSTDTLDSEGETLERSPLPSWWPHDAGARMGAALENERARTEQLPPIYSAIKVRGRSAHARVRAGEHVELAPRPVAVRELEAVGELGEHGRFSLLLTVSKGYYVRALARDIGVAIGVPAHLCALRRETSGVFALAESVALEEVAPDRLIPVAAVADRVLPTATLTGPGAVRARCGAVLTQEDFVAPPAIGRGAWLDERGALVAVGDHDEERTKVVRVFSELKL